MFGNNQIAKIAKHNGDRLEVVKIFKTIQGEGFYSGHPAIFIRLGGCNLQCYFCDTEFDKYKKIKITSILTKVKKIIGTDKIKLIVITGGEPLRQPIEKLSELLLEENFTIQIETNGTIKRKLSKKIHICCSPKITNKQYDISAELINYADSFKFIISASGYYKQIASLNINKPIYIQPMDEYDPEKNQQNHNLTIKLAKKYGYIISLQTHKYLNIE
jgi:7-carboxy-7-deazaguanine synthase